MAVLLKETALATSFSLAGRKANLGTQVVRGNRKDSGLDPRSNLLDSQAGKTGGELHGEAPNPDVKTAVDVTEGKQLPRIRIRK